MEVEVKHHVFDKHHVFNSIANRNYIAYISFFLSYNNFLE